MALFTTDLTGELDQVKGMVADVVDHKLNPMIQGAIAQAASELGAVVRQAGDQLEANVKLISDEIHDQRRVTKEDIIQLIDYATNKIADTMDARIAVAKDEVSALVSDKIAMVRVQLEDAAVQSRRTLYMNLALSMLGAVAMAAIGLIYRKITLNQLDIFSLFRVFLLSTATGTGLYAALKFFANWRGLNQNKKNAATIAINYLGILRPNGAMRLFIISLLLAAGWAVISFFPHLIHL
jgi:hypothetical protein